MMKYRQSNSTFIPKEKTDSGFDTPAENNSGPSKEKLLSQIKRYDDKIKELEKQLELKYTEIDSSNNLILSLEEEINKLKNGQKGIQGPVDTAKISSLNIELENIKEENARLKKEIAMQNEHTQLLYVLIIVLAII